MFYVTPTGETVSLVRPAATGLATAFYRLYLLDALATEPARPGTLLAKVAAERLPLCHAYYALRRAGIVSTERPEVVCQGHFDFVCPVWRHAQRQGQSLADGTAYDSSTDDVSGTAER